MKGVVQFWRERIVDFEGSTRLVGLLRIACVLVIWARYGETMALPLNTEYPAVAITFWFATTAMLVGFKSQLSTAITALVLVGLRFGYGHYAASGDFVSHHTQAHTLFTFGLALTPCGRSYSMDRWMAVREAASLNEPPPRELGPLFGQALIGLQASALYFWTAVDKTSWAFLSGSRLEMVFMERVFGSDYPEFIPGFSLLMLALAVGVTVFEFFLPFGLWVRRWQWWLVPVGMIFHGLIYIGIPVSTFTVTMSCMLASFLDPDTVHRAIDRLVPQ